MLFSEEIKEDGLSFFFFFIAVVIKQGQFTLQGQLAISGDSFDDHNWGRGSRC